MTLRLVPVPLRVLVCPSSNPRRRLWSRTGPQALRDESLRRGRDVASGLCRAAAGVKRKRAVCAGSSTDSLLCLLPAVRAATGGSFGQGRGGVAWCPAKVCGTVGGWGWWPAGDAGAGTLPRQAAPWLPRTRSRSPALADSYASTLGDGWERHPRLHRQREHPQGWDPPSEGLVRGARAETPQRGQRSGSRAGSASCVSSRGGRRGNASAQRRAVPFCNARLSFAARWANAKGNASGGAALRAAPCPGVY